MLSKLWSDAKYLREARREPARLEFWLQYEPNILEASKSVCDNPPSFDQHFRQVFPNAKKFRAMKIKELAATVPPEAGAANNRSDEIAFLESLLPGLKDKFISLREFVFFESAIDERIAQLRAVR